MKHNKFSIRTAMAFGLRVGLGIGTVITVLVTAWEWFQNPGGIFHGSAGTQWPIVIQTAWSWFVPTCVVSGLCAAVLRSAWLASR